MTFQLTQQEGKFLVQLARKAVEQLLLHSERVPMPSNTPLKLKQNSGVFVTIEKVTDRRRELRGCIGYPYPTTPLAQAVVETSISSATQDPRFPPLTEEELNQVVFEVSTLTPPKLIEVKNPKQLATEIQVGRDGLLVQKGIYNGLLLPQVPIENNWDEMEFLSQCCLKAGLPPDSWLILGTKVHKFEAIVFKEETPKGRIERRHLQRN